MADMEESAEAATDASIDSIENLLRRSLVSRNKQTIIVKSPDGSTVFCCVECNMKYTDKESMELHLCMHNKEYRFICTVCGTGLKRKEHLERHTLGHQEVRPHACADCGKAFKRKEHLTIHRAIHSGHKELSCPLCDRSFHRKDHLQKHLQSHSNKFKKQGISVEDDSVTQIKTEADEDLISPIITSVHGNAMDPDVMVKFELLQESLESEKQMEQSFGHSGDPERPFACLICYKTYKRKDHLKLHSKSHLKKEQVCSECGKAFHKQEELLYHMNEHLDSSSLLESEMTSQLQIVELKRPPWISQSESSLLVPRAPAGGKDGSLRAHECLVCHKRFKRKQHLKVHSNVHTKLLLSIWCSLCNEGFQTNDQFEAHECLMINSEGNSENINDSQSQNNIMEITDHHFPEKQQDLEDPPPEQRSQLTEEDPSIPVPQKVFVCKFCQKPFRRRDHYRIHLNIHTGHKSFFCPDCGKGFYRKDHLQKHLPVHTRVRKQAGANKKAMPVLIPIGMVTRSSAPAPLLPEITIHAPSNAKLRVPLQMKVPYEVVTCTADGEERAVINPNQTF